MFVCAVAKFNCPPSSPVDCVDDISPVTFKVPVISLFELTDTNTPVSVIFESLRWSPPADFATLLFVNVNSLPSEPELLGPDIKTPPPYVDSLDC